MSLHPVRHDGAAAPQALAAWLHRAARDLSQQPLPADLGARIQVAVAAQMTPRLALQPAPGQPGPRHGGGWRWLFGSGAAVCVLALVLSLWLMSLPYAITRAPMAPQLSTGFMPLVSPERWQQLTSGNDGPAWLVRSELPREHLAELGLPYDPARAGEPVHTELLLHRSGAVLALRLISH